MSVSEILGITNKNMYLFIRIELLNKLNWNGNRIGI